jgi:hypothetical protein
MSNPPPYTDITGITRAVMKDNAQVSIVDYNGNARPGELVVAQGTTNLYIGNSLGQLTLVASGIAVSAGNVVPAGSYPLYYDPVTQQMTVVTP